MTHPMPRVDDHGPVRSPPRFPGLRCLLLLAGSAWATAASAQASEVVHDGTWAATIQPAQGARRTATVTVREFAGEWQYDRAGAPPACAGRKLPITVQLSTVEALEYTVWGTNVSPRCPNLTVAVKPAGPNAFEGSVESVGPIRMTRRSPGTAAPAQGH